MRPRAREVPRIELGDAGARLVGVLWLFAAVGPLIAAYGIWHGAVWAMPLAAVMASVSLALCILGSPAAVAGIVVNVVILGMIACVQVVGSAARPGRLRPGMRGVTK